MGAGLRRGGTRWGWSYVVVGLGGSGGRIRLEWGGISAGRGGAKCEEGVRTSTQDNAGTTVLALVSPAATAAPR